MRLTHTAFKRALGSYRWIESQLTDRSLELVRLRHEQTGLASHGSARVSPPAMARYGKQSRSEIDLIEKIEDVQSEILGLRSVKDSLDKVLERMDETDRLICLALYADGELADSVADDLGYSRSQVYRRAASAVMSALSQH